MTASASHSARVSLGNGGEIGPRPGMGAAMSAREIAHRVANGTIHPATAVGIMNAAYSLKPMCAWLATMKLMGFEITSGATPAAANTQKENGMTRCWRSG